MNIIIIEDKFSVIKNLYPNTNDEIIKYAISILEGNSLKWFNPHFFDIFRKKCGFLFFLHKIKKESNTILVTFNARV